MPIGSILWPSFGHQYPQSYPNPCLLKGPSMQTGPPASVVLRTAKTENGKGVHELSGHSKTHRDGSANSQECSVHRPCALSEVLATKALPAIAKPPRVPFLQCMDASRT